MSCVHTQQGPCASSQQSAVSVDSLLLLLDSPAFLFFIALSFFIFVYVGHVEEVRGQLLGICS